MAHPDRVHGENIPDLISIYDVVIDGTDDLSTRHVVHDACFRAGTFGTVK